MWATKYRYKVLHGAMRERIRQIIIQTCEELGVHIVKGVLVRKCAVVLSVAQRPRRSGGESLGQTGYPRSFEGLSSRTASSNFKSLRDDDRHQHSGISQRACIRPLQSFFT
ncbi:MAG: hypothetical protein DCO98_11445 [Altererythrobacter sp. XM-24bin4]|nr:MAG: hypothetical protein DCO98_11445 [Altererythrobacter sp. XM-24bin4]